MHRFEFSEIGVPVATKEMGDNRNQDQHNVISSVQNSCRA
jgi:hypothetical protein